ncbi:MAG TPA: ATP-binding protein, partial [Euryarchaeota archaeon]|nr:ATP-binding protein [Euryarchaeota archaeon]
MCLNHLVWWMIRPELMEIISPFNFWERELDTGYPREEYLDRFEDYLKVPSTIVAVTGVRRSGKTYLCRQMIRRLMEKGVNRHSLIFVNMEDPALEPYLGTQLLIDIHETYIHYMKPQGSIYFFIDEAQTIKGWERWVRSMVEKSSNVKVIVTGSSSEIMSRELSSLLTGRFMELRIQPFSFKEFLDFRGVLGKTWNERKMQSQLLDYMETGGYPQVLSIEDPGLKDEFLKELFHSTINSDIVNRFGVREVHKLKSLVTLLL